MTQIRRAAGVAALLAALPLAADELPADVSEFLDRANLCYHFRGEEPYDPERSEYLRNMIEETCSGNVGALRALQEKYGADEILRVLATAGREYEIDE